MKTGSITTPLVYGFAGTIIGWIITVFALMNPQRHMFTASTPSPWVWVGAVVSLIGLVSMIVAIWRAAQALELLVERSQ